MASRNDTRRLLNYRLQMLFKSHADWIKGFNGITAATCFKKLATEATEAMETPQDMDEHADCLLVLFSAIALAGYTLDEVLAQAQKKHLVNLTRTWQHKPDGTLQHIDVCTCSQPAGLDNDEHGAFCIACQKPV